MFLQSVIMRAKHAKCVGTREQERLQSFHATLCLLWARFVRLMHAQVSQSLLLKFWVYIVPLPLLILFTCSIALPHFQSIARPIAVWGEQSSWEINKRMDGKIAASLTCTSSVSVHFFDLSLVCVMVSVSSKSSLCFWTINWAWSYN